MFVPTKPKGSIGVSVMERTYYKGFLFIAVILLFVVLLSAGCIRKPEDTLKEDCSAYPKDVQPNCYYEQAMAHAMKNDAKEAVAKCTKIYNASKSTGVKDWLKRLFQTSTIEYYNDCIKKVAYFTQNKTICKNSVNIGLWQMLLPKTANQEDNCEEYVTNQKDNEERMIKDTVSNFYGKWLGISTTGSGSSGKSDDEKD